ncbi:MAG: hypothetical protein JWM80_2927, partial [Cyanobacteria bacterium RYN_339]|nr:hypothetical protein [Cyanobacteria bacterium RYN_339]
AVALTVVLAALSYEGVERRCLALGRRPVEPTVTRLAA